MEPEATILAIYRDLDWLQSVIDQVLRSYFLQEGHEQNWQDTFA